MDPVKELAKCYSRSFYYLNSEGEVGFVARASGWVEWWRWDSFHQKYVRAGSTATAEDAKRIEVGDIRKKIGGESGDT